MTTRLSAHLEPLMENPGWQRAVILAATLFFLALLLYQFLLHGLGLQHDRLTQEIFAARQAVIQVQRSLLRASPLQFLERELKNSVVARQTSLPLAQQFAQPLKASQATLIRWKPVSEQEAGEQGELLLQLSFTRLREFLTVLLQRPEHPVFSALSLHTEASGLKASLLLMQTTDIGIQIGNNAAVIAGRDPFAAVLAASCAENILSPGWMLSGITSAEGQRFGWLLLPDGRWNKVETGTQIGLPLWTVETLGASHMELSISDDRCGQQRQTLRFGPNNTSPGKGK